MSAPIKTYYFSAFSVIGATLLLLSLYVIFFGAAALAWPEHAGYSLLLLAVPVVFIAISWRRYSLYMAAFLKHRPAVVLTEQALVDNINKNHYRWKDIHRIFYTTGGKSGGRTVVILTNETRIEIPHGVIRCRQKEFLQELIACHEKYRTMN